jgi:hypothetical protein
MVLIYKIKKGMVPGYLTDKLQYRHNNRYELHNTDDFKLPKVNKVFTQSVYIVLKKAAHYYYYYYYFPPVLREMRSTSTSLQFRSGTGSSTIVYIHTPEGESDVQFS